MELKVLESKNSETIARIQCASAHFHSYSKLNETLEFTISSAITSQLATIFEMKNSNLNEKYLKETTLVVLQVVH